MIDIPEQSYNPYVYRENGRQIIIDVKSMSSEQILIHKNDPIVQLGELNLEFLCQMMFVNEKLSERIQQTYN